MTVEKEAYERGRDARYMEISTTANPYPIGTAERSAWYRGWTDHDWEISKKDLSQVGTNRVPASSS